MRTLGVYLLLAALLLVSLAAGFAAADWPRWCARARWCEPGWPHAAAGAAAAPAAARAPAVPSAGASAP